MNNTEEKSDPDLQAFFNKNRQKGKKKKPEKKAATKDNQEQTEKKEELNQPQKKQNQEDSADSDEENREIVLDGGTKIKSMNEVKKQENEEEKETSSGWAGFERKRNAEIQPKEESAATKKPQSTPGEINFKRNGPPMFSKKKGIGLA